MVDFFLHSQYADLLKHADLVVNVRDAYEDRIFLIRNEWMVDPLVFWCAMYKVIYQITQSAAQRKQASDWLLSHGFHLPERYAYQ